MTLPEWNLDEFYTSISDPQIEKDLKKILERSENFYSLYNGIFVSKNWDAKTLHKAVFEYENILENIGRINSFFDLSYTKNLKNASVQSARQMVLEKISFINQKLVFFALDVNTIQENFLTKKISV